MAMTVSSEQASMKDIVDSVNETYMMYNNALYVIEGRMFQPHLCMYVHEYYVHSTLE